jgi:hypothetical protein
MLCRIKLNIIACRIVLPILRAGNGGEIHSSIYTNDTNQLAQH